MYNPYSEIVGSDLRVGGDKSMIAVIDVSCNKGAEGVRINFTYHYCIGMTQHSHCPGATVGAHRTGLQTVEVVSELDTQYVIEFLTRTYYTERSCYSQKKTHVERRHITPVGIVYIKIYVQVLVGSLSRHFGSTNFLGNLFVHNDAVILINAFAPKDQ